MGVPLWVIHRELIGFLDYSDAAICLTMYNVFITNYADVDANACGHLNIFTTLLTY